MAVQPHSPGAFTFQPKHSRGIMSCAYLCHTSFTSSEAKRLSCWSRHGFDVGNEVPLPNWDWLEQTGYMYYIIFIHIYICFRVPCCHPPPTTPPPPMVWVQNLHLATFSWNPPKHMVFTMFWQAWPPKPWYLQRFVILHCLLLLL